MRLPDVDALFGFRTLEATLRCILEELTSSGGSRQVSVRVLQERSVEIGPRDVPIGKGDAAGVFALVRRVDEEAFLDLSFPLPDDDLGTVFADDLVRYWELEISADTPGIPFHAAFLLPVYPSDGQGPTARAPREEKADEEAGAGHGG